MRTSALEGPRLIKRHTLPEQLIVPLLNGVGFLLNLVGVGVPVGYEAPPGFHHAVDLFLAGLHGREEVLVLLYGLQCPLQAVGHLGVREHVLLRREQELR